VQAIFRGRKARQEAENVQKQKAAIQYDNLLSQINEEGDLNTVYDEKIKNLD